MRDQRWMIRLACIVSIVSSVGSVGCGHGARVHSAPPQTQPARTERAKRLPLQAPAPPQNGSLADVMGDHFMITSWARNCVIAGSLEPMHDPLTGLANYRYDDVRLGGWVRWVTELQQAARLTAEAATLDAAASGVATMARVCGECHVAQHAGPTIPPKEPLEAAHVEDLDARMARHMWASELLWEGITGPSDASWNTGTKALLEAPDTLDDVLSDNFDARLQMIKKLAVEAEAADTLEQRADVYAALIVTCAGCHRSWIEEHGDE